ncbi:MAG: hypothetical protein ABRQ27_11650 [Clostridiaceae bacterium]
MEKIISKRSIEIILIIFIGIRIAFFLLNKIYNMYFLFSNINQSIINSIVNISIIIAIALLLNNKENNVLKYMFNFLVIVGIFSIVAINIIANSDKHYFYFEAPNKSSTLIVEEESYFFAGWSRFYERKSLFFIKDLKSGISTNDGFKPFSNNCYQLKWIDNTTIELQYNSGSGSKEFEEKTIKIN